MTLLVNMNTITGASFQSMVENGLRNLKAHYQEINDLNVFPVPDGDTGTNMTATLKGGVEAMAKVESDELSDKAGALASGMLLSARGNSGVILSQFFAGIAESFKGLREADLNQFAAALSQGTATAYKAVVNPVEGTILTVAKDGSRAVSEAISTMKSLESVFGLLSRSMSESLKNTPNLLPVLKEAGVIDSGGAGLLSVMEGMRKDVLGEEIEDSLFNGPSSSSSSADLSAFNEDSVLTYGYCTEFILQLQNCKNGPEGFDLNDMIETFKTFGDSIVALRQGNIVKVHVHTKNPALPIQYAQKYGEFLTFKMENMNLQHNEILLKELPIEEETKEYGIVSVSPSPEISSLFKEMKVDQIVSGGQSMNPSADDFVKAFAKTNAKKIIVFPNNGNVILTAKQAAKLYDKSEIHVVPSKSIVEAYSALQLIDFESYSLEENLQNIESSMTSVVSGEVSVAVRDSLNNGINVKKGDAIGILSGALVADEPDAVDCLFATISKIEDIDDRSVITIFFGKDVDDETKEAVETRIEDAYPLMDYQSFNGGQNVYPFIFAVE